VTTSPLVDAVAAPASRRQIRGSSLLLLGRLIALASKLAAQVVLVRHLSVADYGTWAYGLSMVTLLGGFAHLSLDRAVTRFTAIYHERGQHAEFFGAIALVLGTVLATGLLFVGSIHLFHEPLALRLGQEERSFALLLVLVFLVPLDALDTLLVAILASLSSTRAIFVRRYVMAPAIQVGAVLLVAAMHAPVETLAWAYVGGACVGVLTSAWLLVGILRRAGMLGELRRHGVRVPARELFVFSLPLMTSDWLAALLESSGTLVLGYFYDTEHVALFRTVVPLAMLNKIVMQSFGTLYEPAVSRLFARGDVRGIGPVYWETTLWIAVLSFPIFAMTFAAATPLTVLLYGARYEAAGTLLAILSVGQFVQATSGFNGMTIKSVGRVHYLVVINLVALAVNVALTLALVPTFGATGAAIALTVTLVVHNVLKQVGLYRATGILLPDRRLARSFVAVGATIAALTLLLALGMREPAVLVLGAIAASIAVLRFARHNLRIAEVFPELGRIRYLRPLLT
jgi:O-antigen/teichoic acid export membrane protein